MGNLQWCRLLVNPLKQQFRKTKTCLRTEFLPHSLHRQDKLLNYVYANNHCWLQQVLKIHKQNLCVCVCGGWNFSMLLSQEFCPVRSLQLHWITNQFTRTQFHINILPMSQPCAYEYLEWRQYVAWSHSMNTDNSSFDRVGEFKYLWTTLTNQNSIQEEIKSKLKSGAACYNSVQNLLSFYFLSKN
jgi:hypothetical protein